MQTTIASILEFKKKTVVRLQLHFDAYNGCCGLGYVHRECWYRAVLSVVLPILFAMTLFLSIAWSFRITSKLKVKKNLKTSERLHQKLIDVVMALDIRQDGENNINDYRICFLLILF